MDTKTAKERIKEIHGEKYELEKDWEYRNAKSDIKLICKEHGEFHKDFYHLVNMGQGCPVCSHNGKVYKPPHYWNNYENCLNEAKKYINKFELQRKCIACYKSLRRNGWLDDISKQCFDNTVIYMGYEEKRNLVYVYEFPEFKVFYVGRTNNIKRRHKQHRDGFIHSNGKREFDSIYRFANENNIDVPEPKILETELNAEESQLKEDEWKNKYLDDGWKTLNVAVTGVGKGSLGATLKWTYESCKNEDKKYDSKYAMKKACQPAYLSSVKNGWIDEFFVNKNKVSGFWGILENVLDAAKQSKGARDMIKRFGGAYNSAKKNGWLNLLEYGKN